MKLSDLQPSKSGFKLVQYGDYGSGKSLRALRATRFGPVKLFDTDNKIVGLKEKITAAEQALIDVESITDYDDFSAKLTKFLQNPVGYNTLVVDTWNAAHRMTVNKGFELNPKGDGRAIYGDVKRKNTTLFERLMIAPLNVIVNMHAGLEPFIDGSVRISPSTAGTFGQEMPGYVNEVHYAYLNINNEYKIRVKPASNIVARTALPDALIDSSGILKISGLEIFDNLAKKTT